MTQIAFVLGNGESRRGIKIADLKPHGKVWACNGVYRSEEPDVLVAVDPKMILEIAETEYPSPTKCGPIGIISMKRWSVPRTTYSIIFTDTIPKIMLAYLITIVTHVSILIII